MTHEFNSTYIIKKYRELIEVRYTFEEISKKIDVPPQITAEMVDDVRQYFLSSIYPEPEKRAQLEEAFKTLGGFISKPSKIWRLLGNMTMSIFKFGRMFPLALKTGYRSLHAFLDAKAFESEIAAAADLMNFHIPLSREQFDQCIQKIPRKRTYSFLDEVMVLFEAIANPDLVIKTVDILQSVLDKMQSYPHIYNDKDVEGIFLGLEILRNGYNLFQPMSPQDRQLVLDVIRRNEQEFFKEVYND